MAKIPDKIRAIIEKYISVLRDNNIPIKNAYLFGSYAKGNNNEWSDIDIALISDLFEGVRIKDKIRRITLSVSSNLEILPFRPDDFSLENPLAKEIIETGIRLV
ncbi:MAG: nucleotidyltransferase domain-containing protein [Ignavibacteria bacterium]|jgi:predicted nucleotidyltransferase